VRLLFAIKSLHVEGGGAERVLTQVVSGLVERGHEVAVLTFDPPGAGCFYPVHAEVNLLSIGIGATGRPTPRWELLRALPTLRQQARRARPEVVVAFMHSMYLPLGLALVGSGLPMIASEHQVATYYKDRPVERALLCFVPALAKSITVTSEHVKATFPRWLQARMVTIPNPAPALPMTPPSLASREHVVLNVGSLTPQKNQRTLIEAFARVACRHPGWRLRIVGEGPLRAKLEALVAVLDLADRVELPGTRADIEHEYRRAAVFAIPSSFESFGLVTTEALANELPVLGFADCPGTNELIVHGHNGLLVDGTNRTQSLSEALDRLMTDSSLRAKLGRRGPRSLAPYAVGGVLERWEDLLAAASRRRK
jgi:GalNAc-alpha-(1->4)-GalNAc-alpha-(1->3)-diNAcBac-PP-undecaprenol alpha-1,4-N-acetyl-D-galactosaminyltransferase